MQRLHTNPTLATIAILLQLPPLPIRQQSSSIFLAPCFARRLFAQTIAFPRRPIRLAVQIGHIERLDQRRRVHIKLGRIIRATLLPIRTARTRRAAHTAARARRARTTASATTARAPALIPRAG